jgi:hypothetical protein
MIPRRRGKTKTHEEEKRSDARLEACNVDARLPVQSTAEHAETRGYHYMCQEERLVPVKFKKVPNDQISIPTV